MLSQNKGFEFVFDIEQQTLRIKAWGRWNTEFAKKFHQTFMEKIEELETEGKEWTLSVDFSNLTAQSQEARETLLQPIFYVKKQKVNVRVTSDGTSAIGEQFQNLFVETDNSQTILRTVLIPPPSIPPQAGGSRQETSPLQFPPPFTGGERGVMRQLSELLIKSLE